MGAVVEFGDGTYWGVKAGHFLIDGGQCYAKDGTHDTAKYIPVKRLIGSVDGYVLVEWDWNKHEEAQIAESRVTGLGSDDIKTGANSNKATQNQQLPTEVQFKHADKFYAIFRDKNFLDICTKANFDVTGMKNAEGTVKWKILHRKKAEGQKGKGNIASRKEGKKNWRG